VERLFVGIVRRRVGQDLREELGFSEALPRAGRGINTMSLDHNLGQDRQERTQISSCKPCRDFRTVCELVPSLTASLIAQVWACVSVKEKAKRRPSGEAAGAASRIESSASSLRGLDPSLSAVKAVEFTAYRRWPSGNKLASLTSASPNRRASPAGSGSDHIASIVGVSAPIRTSMLEPSAVSPAICGLKPAQCDSSQTDPH
jgi:hypothetical protein